MDSRYRCIRLLRSLAMIVYEYNICLSISRYLSVSRSCTMHYCTVFLLLLLLFLCFVVTMTLSLSNECRKRLRVKLILERLNINQTEAMVAIASIPWGQFQLFLCMNNSPD